MNESIPDKALRYVREQRVILDRVEREDGVLVVGEARCLGGGVAPYVLRWYPDAQRWTCTCRARRVCCHKIAVQCVCPSKT